MEHKPLNALYMGLLGVLLTIIGYFLAATYQKISDTNVRIYQIQAELAQIRERQRHFMNYQEVSSLVDKKINQYHREISTK